MIYNENIQINGCQEYSVIKLKRLKSVSCYKYFYSDNCLLYGETILRCNDRSAFECLTVKMPELVGTNTSVASVITIAMVESSVIQEFSLSSQELRWCCLHVLMV